MTPEDLEVAVLSRVWARRRTVERYEGLVEVRAVTLSGAYPATRIEVRWRDLRSRSNAEDSLSYPVWHKWSNPDTADAEYLAEDVIEDVYLRAIGD